MCRPQAVGKEQNRDRLVLDAFPAKWVYALSAPSTLATLVLQPGETLLMSDTDLKDCFYQFVAPPQRTVRNLPNVRHIL